MERTPGAPALGSRGTVEAVTGCRLGPHPLDDDDMTACIVRSVLQRRMGASNPSIDAVVDDITQRLRAYEMHKLGALVGQNG